MEKSVRLQDIAELLNLSISTVSKALNNSSEISTRTKEKVKEVAILKRYIPNSMAQNLKGKKSRIIGVIIPDIFSIFFSEALHAIEKKANQRGYYTMICFSNGSVQKETECIERLIKCRVDGIIIAVSKKSLYKKINEHLERTWDFKLPVVMFDCVEDNIVCDKVGLDETFLAEEATMNLFQAGYRNIAFFSKMSCNRFNEAHKNGYLQAIKRKNSKEIMLNHHESSPQKLQDLIRLEKIDAFLVTERSSANLIENSFVEAKISIPENFYILSLSNLEKKGDSLSSFDSLDRKGAEQGDIAVDTLIDRIEGVLSDEFLKFELKPPVIRGKTNKIGRVSV